MTLSDREAPALAFTVALVSLVDAEAWADFLERRSDGLRKKGILSIGFNGYSAVLAPAEPDVGEQDDAGETSTEADDPVSPWENPASYPTGHVPTLEADEAKELPEIPNFGDD